jgi:dTMP kinase
MEIGRFIVIEAVDRAGKTTQIETVAATLAARGWRVALTAYPIVETPLTGPLIIAARGGELPLVPDLGAASAPVRRAAQRRQMLLVQQLFSLNRREGAAGLEALLRANEVVISSRYALSGRVYAEASGIRPEEIGTMLATLEADLRRPDLTLVLDLDPNVAAGRARPAALDAFDRDLALQRRVRAGYRRAAERDHLVRIVDADGTPEEVGIRIMAALDEALPDLSARIWPR